MDEHITETEKQQLEEAIAGETASLDRFVEKYRNDAAEVGPFTAFSAMTFAMFVALGGDAAVSLLAVAIKKLADLEPVPATPVVVDGELVEAEQAAVETDAVLVAA